MLHPNATTTIKTREYIQKNSHKKVSVLAKELGVSETTIRRWKNRKTVQDYSSRPHHVHCSFTKEQEAVIVELRTILLLSLDDLLAIVKEFIHPKASRSSLMRLLKRNHLSRLNQLISHEKEQKKKKTFKDYLPGYIHIDIKYLPKLSDEKRRKYLYVAIDRATRWVYFEIFPDKSAQSSAKFLDHLIVNCPIKINKILTDNGKEFTDRFTKKGEKVPSGKHLFDHMCTKNHIEHRLIRPRNPATNGMVERFNGRIESILKTIYFNNYEELEKALYQYRATYLTVIPQKALQHKTPLQKLQEYYASNPELFSKPPTNVSEPDK